MRYHPYLAILVLSIGSLVDRVGGRSPCARRRARRPRSRRAGDSRSIRAISASASTGTTPALTDPAGPRWRCLAPGTCSTRRCAATRESAGTASSSTAHGPARARSSTCTFGRVMYHAKVWLNGELLGEHVDGYLPFAFDVTGKLKDSVNHLVLRVDNRPRIDLAAGGQADRVGAVRGHPAARPRREQRGRSFSRTSRSGRSRRARVPRSRAPPSSMPVRERTPPASSSRSTVSGGERGEPLAQASRAGTGAAAGRPARKRR